MRFVFVDFDGIYEMNVELCIRFFLTVRLISLERFFMRQMQIVRFDKRGGGQNRSGGLQINQI